MYTQKLITENILKSINIILTGILLFEAIPAGIGLSEGVENPGLSGKTMYNLSNDSVCKSKVSVLRLRYISRNS